MKKFQKDRPFLCYVNYTSCVHTNTIVVQNEGTPCLVVVYADGSVTQMLLYVYLVDKSLAFVNQQCLYARMNVVGINFMELANYLPSYKTHSTSIKRPSKIFNNFTVIQNNNTGVGFPICSENVRL